MSALAILSRIRHIRCVFALGTISVLEADLGHLFKSCNVRYVISAPGDVRELEAHPASETGILTDLLVYTLIIPVIPYQLEALGYDGIGAKISWLLVAFVRLPSPPNCSLLTRFGRSPGHWRCRLHPWLTTPRSIVTAKSPSSSVSLLSSAHRSCSWRPLHTGSWCSLASSRASAQR